MALSQGLYQRQLQKLSPQQIQLMKLLQVPTAMLEERIKEELEENPALETGEEEEAEEFENDTTEEFETKEDEFDLDGSKDEYENIDISDYVQDGDDDIADYKMRDENYPEQDDNKVIPHRVETGFNEIMLEQVGQLNLDEHKQQVAEQIIAHPLDTDAGLEGHLRHESPPQPIRNLPDCSGGVQTPGLQRCGYWPDDFIHPAQCSAVPAQHDPPQQPDQQYSGQDPGQQGRGRRRDHARRGWICRRDQRHQSLSGPRRRNPNPDGGPLPAWNYPPGGPGDGTPTGRGCLRRADPAGGVLPGR